MIAVIAHRGASVRFPENTLDAFIAAARMGADMVELDVRRSADSALVVHHDACLPDGRPIVTLRANELPPWVPLLDAALDACDGMGVNVEIKNFPGDPDYDPDQTVAAAVVDLIQDRGDEDRVLVSSFNLAAVDAVRLGCPDITTGFLTLAGWDQHSALRQAVDRGHGALHPQHEGVTADLVVAAHALGVLVNTWTVDEPDRMLELAALGVDGIVTNVADIAITTLRRDR